MSKADSLPETSATGVSVTRRPSYVIALAIAFAYTAIYCGVGALCVHPVLANFYPGSLRYQLGAQLYRIYPHLCFPILPLGWLCNRLNIDPSPFDLLPITIYMFAVTYPLIAIIRWLWKRVAPSATDT